MNNLITKNKKAYFDYEIKDSFEAGIELKGYEVKSIRSGHINLKGSYLTCLGSYIFIKGMYITPWKSIPKGLSVIPDRERKVYLHKKDILFLSQKSKESGFSIIPLELYFKGSLIKLKVGLAKGKKEYEKKQILKERTLDKEAKIAINKFN